MLNTQDEVIINKIGRVQKIFRPKHAEQGLHFEHLWRNVDDPDEVQFLFRIDNPTLAKQFIERVHKEALKQDPTVNLPLMTYLEER